LEAGSASVLRWMEGEKRRTSTLLGPLDKASLHLLVLNKQILLHSFCHFKGSWCLIFILKPFKKTDYLTPKMTAPEYFEMTGTTHPMTQCYIPEYLSLQQHCCDKLVSHILFTVTNFPANHITLYVKQQTICWPAANVSVCSRLNLMVNMTGICSNDPVPWYHCCNLQLLHQTDAWSEFLTAIFPFEHNRNTYFWVKPWLPDVIKLWIHRAS
jgi:hypothetical protein